MSRSYKKTPILGHCAAVSEKQDKRDWHSRFRAMERTRMANISDWEYGAYLGVLVNEASSPWSMSKDGKHYWKGAEDKDMRK